MMTDSLDSILPSITISILSRQERMTDMALKDLIESVGILCRDAAAPALNSIEDGT